MNSGMLYFRMFLTMGVMFYASRVIINIMGVQDFGVYYLVGGFVAMLGFLYGAMASATLRYFSFELGSAENSLPLQKVFSMSVNIHALIAIGILIFAETVGLWFVSTQLNIPDDRLGSALWVYHLSLVTFLIQFVCVPYNALILANEKMSFFAWVSVLDASLKLSAVLALAHLPGDSLINFAILSCLVVACVSLAYKRYCTLRYAYSKFRLFWDSVLFREMLTYTGWNLWGNLASVLSNHGVNVLLNIFFGPVVNAARTVALQISNALNNFVQNVQSALNPQIIKAYSVEEFRYMNRLICIGAKYNFFILLFLSAPVLMYADSLLTWWLKSAPPYSVMFTKLAVLHVLIDSLSLPLRTAAQATGKIRLYQSVVGGILLLNVPVCYVLLHYGFDPYSTFWVGIVLAAFCLVCRMVIVAKLIDLPAGEFFRAVCEPAGTVVFTSGGLIYAISRVESFQALGDISSSVLTCAVVAVCILLVGVRGREFNHLIEIIRNRRMMSPAQ